MKKGSLNEKRFSLFVALFMVIFLLFSSGGYAYASIEPSKVVVIKNATVVDVYSGKLKTNKNIIIVNNRIDSIVDSEGAYIPGKAQTFDAKGKYVIPGLWDMHTHLLKTCEDAFPLLLANGVTGVRDMGTPLDAIDSWKIVAESGAPVPRIVHAGRTLNQLPKGRPEPPHMASLYTEEEARKAVRDSVAKGANHIKIYGALPKNIVLAILDEAKKYNLPLAGHLPAEISVIEASNMGIKSIEHLGGLFIATSNKEEELLANPKLREDEIFSMESDIKCADLYDEKKAEKLFNILIKNQTWQVPTLVVQRNISLKALDPRSKYVPTSYQKQWGENLKIYESVGLISLYERYFPKSMKLLNKMNAAGVPILAGTDSTFEANNQIYGVSLQDELQLLVQAGLTPLQALQAATLNPAKYLNREYELGSVDSGKLADLVILDGNPLENIENTAKIAAVILDGKLMSKTYLDKQVKTYDIVNPEVVKAN